MSCAHRTSVQRIHLWTVTLAEAHDTIHGAKDNVKKNMKIIEDSTYSSLNAKDLSHIINGQRYKLRNMIKTG